MDNAEIARMLDVVKHVDTTGIGKGLCYSHPNGTLNGRWVDGHEHAMFEGRQRFNRCQKSQLAL